MSGNKKGFFQPIWNTTSNRLISAITAWAGMALILLAGFLPTAKVSLGGGILGVVVNMVIDTILPVSSFSLFSSGKVIILVLLIVALVLGIVIPLVTAIPLELIPCAMVIGVNIYASIEKMDIIVASNLKALGEEVSAENVEGYMAELESYASGMNNLAKLGIGFWLSMVGVILLIISVILWFVLKPGKEKAQEEEGTKRTDDYDGEEGDYYGGDRYADTLLFEDPDSTSETSTENDGTVVVTPAGRLVRLNTGESFALPEGEVVIGRDKNKASYVINGNFISSAHARIITSQGYSSIVDMHSTNGTYVNDQRLVPEIKVSLKDGDYVSLGAEVLQYHQG